MRGIIIKPSLCCGSTKSLGKIVEIIGEEKPHKVTTCQTCGSRNKADNHYLIKLSDGRMFCCHKSRIRILPDDELPVYETEKELEVIL